MTVKRIKSTNWLEAVANRLDHLQECAEWIARTTVHTDSGVSQTATLITTLSEEIREAVINLIQEVEEVVNNKNFH
ncbi:MAG: hypothetical protein D6780_01395 [Candidatus Dadabacteria bacterium]|nr:MAG: hypothetical protein D6780_01395 [Candidatus Dadabacteria bacterium]